MNYLAVIAQSDDMPRWLEMLLAPERMGLLIPILAIVGALTFAIVKAIIHHRERIAKIQNGIDPDATEDKR
jgi:hypothetical protein